MGTRTGMTDSLEFIPATPLDIPVIFEQAKALVDQYEDKSLIDYSKVISWIRRKIEHNLFSYVCVYKNGRKVAYYSLCSCDRGFELDDLYVLPEFRGQGIGSEVLKKCLSESGRPLFLYVFIDNTVAVSLYRRFGFEITEMVSTTRMIMTCRS